MATRVELALIERSNPDRSARNRLTMREAGPRLKAGVTMM